MKINNSFIHSWMYFPNKSSVNPKNQNSPLTALCGPQCTDYFSSLWAKPLHHWDLIIINLHRKTSHLSIYILFKSQSQFIWGVCWAWCYIPAAVSPTFLGPYKTCSASYISVLPSKDYRDSLYSYKNASCHTHPTHSHQVWVELGIRKQTDDQLQIMM